MLPNHRLLARAFHRVPSNVTSTSTSVKQARRFSLSAAQKKWEGRKAEENTSREKDSHNVQHDAVKEGKSERASGEGSVGSTEKGGEANKKAEKDHKEAPTPVIGMNDERGGVSWIFYSPL